MRTIFALALLTVGIPLSSIVSGAAATNPADLYTQAFDRLEKDKGDLKPLDNVDRTSMNDATTTFLKDRAEAVALLREAAKMPAASWPVTQAETGGVMPSLNSARQASRLLLLQTRYDLHEKQPALAADDALATMALGRNVAQRKSIISTLVDIGIEMQAMDKLAAMLPALPRDVVATLPARIDALPKPLSGKAMMDGEFEFGKTAASADQNVPPAIFEAAAPFYRAVGDAMAQPREQFEQTVDAEAMKLMLNPFVKSMATTIKRVHQSVLAIDAKRAMFDAAVAVSINGPDAVKLSKDPAGDGPFEYAQTPSGFTLTSKALDNRNKPVTLIVGK